MPSERTLAHRSLSEYVWRREYAPAGASAGRSATACAVTLFTSGRCHGADCRKRVSERVLV